MFLSGCICVCLYLHAAVEENPVPSQISRGPALQDRSPACLSVITLGPTLDHSIPPSVMAKATFTLWNSSFPCPSLESFVFYHLSRTTISPVTRTRTMEVLLNFCSLIFHIEQSLQICLKVTYLPNIPITHAPPLTLCHCLRPKPSHFPTCPSPNSELVLPRCQQAWVWSVVRELDPTCCNLESTSAVKGPACHTKAWHSQVNTHCFF